MKESRLECDKNVADPLFASNGETPGLSFGK
jgi:hypothetical protein